MTIGFEYQTSPSKYATPDKTANRRTRPRILLQTFGDGYEQRAVDGINVLREEFSLTFSNREKAEIDDIAAFLDDKKGVTKFTLTMPDTKNTTRAGEKDIKVVCEDYSLQYKYDDFYTLTTKLRRVYEA